MPFGLTNVPAVFQALINNVLRDFLNLLIFVYLDDTPLFSRSQAENQTHVHSVWQVKTDPAKVQTVAEWLVPASQKMLQCFLGFTNIYWCFIRDYSKGAAPLSRLAFPKVQFVWSTEADPAFLRLKTLFTSAPVLIHPDTRLPFVVEVDAWEGGVGALLSQHSAPQGTLQPCAFFSQWLSPAECNYDIGDCKLLAIRVALHLFYGNLTRDIKSTVQQHL